MGRVRKKTTHQCIGVVVLVFFFFYIWQALKMLQGYESDGAIRAALKGTAVQAKEALGAIELEEQRIGNVMKNLERHTSEIERDLARVAEESRKQLGLTGTDKVGEAQAQGSTSLTAATSTTTTVTARVAPISSTHAAETQDLAASTGGSGSDSSSSSHPSVASSALVTTTTSEAPTTAHGAFVPGAIHEGPPSLLVVGGTDGSGTRGVVQMLVSLGVPMVRATRILKSNPNPNPHPYPNPNANPYPNPNA